MILTVFSGIFALLYYLLKKLVTFLWPIVLFALDQECYPRSTKTTIHPENILSIDFVWLDVYADKYRLQLFPPQQGGQVYPHADFRFRDVFEVCQHLAVSFKLGAVEFSLVGDEFLFRLAVSRS